MKREFRVSVSLPFSSTRVWANGSPDKIRLDDRVQNYPANVVADVIASLKRVVIPDAVITIY